jgi:predicted nuclease of predicted toxin-antitoxin system
MFTTLACVQPATIIWDYALQNGAVIITKDEDFVTLTNINFDSPHVVWVRVGNVGKQALLLWIEPLLASIINEIESGEKLIEIA